MHCWCFSGNFMKFSDMFSFKRSPGIMIFASHPTCIFAFCFFALSVFLVSFASTVWSPFCKCSKTCGGGVKIRTRNCPMPSTRKEKKCQIPTVEIQECNKIVCPGNVFFYYVKCWWRNSLKDYYFLKIFIWRLSFTTDNLCTFVTWSLNRNSHFCWHV